MLQQDAPLVSGMINIIPTRQLPVFYASADISINLTRALVYQAPYLSALRAQTGANWARSQSVPRLSATERRSSVTSEMPLNTDQDNVILGRLYRINVRAAILV